VRSARDRVAEWRDLACLFKPIVLARMEKAGENPVPEWYYDRYVEVEASHDGKMFASFIDERMILAEVDRVAPEVGLSPEEIVRQLATATIEAQFLKDRTLKYLEVLVTLAWHIRNVIGMVSVSEHEQIPLALSGKLTRFAAAGIPDGSGSHREAIRCYRIFADEMGTFPAPRSLTEALRLRDDPRISSWREALHGWADRLRVGDVQGEAEMRKCLRAAIDDLRKIVRMRDGNGGVALYLGLPLAVVDMFCAVPLVGSLLTAVSSAVEIGGRAAANKHRWMLLGQW
jgi:hypothetical protein